MFSPRQPYQWTHPRPYPSRGFHGQSSNKPTTPLFTSPRECKSPLFSSPEEIGRQARPSPKQFTPSPRPHASPFPQSPLYPFDPPNDGSCGSRTTVFNYAGSPSDPPLRTGPTRMRDQAKATRRMQRQGAFKLPLSGNRTPKDSLDEEASMWHDNLAFSGPLDEEDQIMLHQIEKLRLDSAVRRNLVKEKETVDRAAKEGPERSKQRDEVFFAFRRAHERVMEDIRLACEAAREKAKLKAKRLEEQERERRRKEEEARWLAEMQMRKERVKREAEARRAAEERKRQSEAREKERLERERKQQEEATRRARLREEELRRMQAAAQRTQDAARASELEAYFLVNAQKWDHLLKGNLQPSSITFGELPWPILGVVNSPADISCEGLRQFIFHPLRKTADGTTRRGKVKAELLKWHPDKFNAKVVSKVKDGERDLAMEAAGLVARFLNQVMAEEGERERQGP